MVEKQSSRLPLNQTTTLTPLKLTFPYRKQNIEDTSTMSAKTESKHPEVDAILTKQKKASKVPFPFHNTH